MCWAMILILGSVAGGDVEVVRNPLEANKGLTLILDEEMRVESNEDSSHYYWPGVGLTLSVGPKHHIFLSDSRDDRVLEFDANGAFVRTVAGKGPGPGEINELIGFQVFDDGTAVMMDLQGQIARFQFFDAEMKYQRLISAHQKSIMPLYAVFSPDQKIICGRYINFDPEKGRVIHKWGVFNHQFEGLHVMAEGSLPMPRAELIGNSSGLKSFISKYVSLFKRVEGFGVFDKMGHVYTAAADKYEIVKWSPGLEKPLLKITKTYKPIPYGEGDMDGVVVETYNDFVEELPTELKQLATDSLLRKAIEESDMGLTKVPIFGLIPVENTHFLVVHDLKYGTGSATADIFTVRGEFVGSVNTEGYALLNPQGVPRMVFKDGKAFTILTDEEGDNVIVRYKYRIAAR